MAEWFEIFFDGIYSRILAHQAQGASGMDEARKVKRLLGLRKGRRVMDIPCGLGRLTFPMAQMGLKMTGVDLTESYIRRDRRKARRDAMDATFVRCDMRRIEFKDEFDAAFNWGGSFGYFSDSDSLEFCRRILAALKPGGRFLVESRNLSWHLRPGNFRNSMQSTVGGVTVTEGRRWNSTRTRVLSDWTMAMGKKSVRRQVDMRFFSGGEIRAMLKSAGFRDIRVSDSTPPYGRLTSASKRWIAMGTKPRKRERPT